MIYFIKSSNISFNDKVSDLKNERDKECLGKIVILVYSKWKV